MQLELSAPKVITFVISVVLALIAAVAHYAHIALPFSRTGFTLLLGLSGPHGRQRLSERLGADISRGSSPKGARS